MRKVLLFLICFFLLLPLPIQAKENRNNVRLKTIDRNLQTFFAFIENLKANNFEKYRIFVAPVQREVTSPPAKRQNYLDNLVNKLLQKEDKK